MPDNTEDTLPWPKRIFSDVGPRDLDPPEQPDHARVTASRASLWTQALFKGHVRPGAGTSERVVIARDGVPVLELSLPELPAEAVIGRHPACAIQLEAYGLGLFHACLWRFDDEYYIEALDARCDAALDCKRLKPKHPVRLYDGAVVAIPGHQLLFTLPASLATGDHDPGLEENGELPALLRPAETATREPAPLPWLQANRGVRLWSEGITQVKVVDIIDETPDTKTLRCVGVQPLLFAYRPGQFVTLLLELDGREVQRSYSMSSSPSRPHTLDLTVKRIPEGLVSNWLCDHVQPGEVLRIKGPSGKFTCVESSSRKLLFLAAGSGVTPIMSMCRWLIDTAAEVDVKLLASFRSPSEIIFRKELEWMSSHHRTIRVGLSVTAGWQGTECWTGFTGRINTQMLSLIAPDYREREIFLCGPDSFMDDTKALLRDLDFDFSALHCESFSAGRVARGPAKPSGTLTLTGRRHSVTFLRSGLTVDTDEHTTLLDLAEAHGIEIAYSCRSGCCGECEVKCRGEVALAPTCEIDAQSRTAGFVWSCSCTARSDLELDA